MDQTQTPDRQKTGWWQSLKGNTLYNAAKASCAAAFANYLDEQAITPEALEKMAAEDRKVLLEALSQVPYSAMQTARHTMQEVGARFTRDTYMEILQEDVLSVQHPLHVEVVLRHLRWYGVQMDEARQVFFNQQ